MDKCEKFAWPKGRGEVERLERQQDICTSVKKSPSNELSFGWSRETSLNGVDSQSIAGLEEIKANQCENFAVKILAAQIGPLYAVDFDHYRVSNSTIIGVVDND